MRIFLGLFFTTLTNFSLGLLGFYFTTISFLNAYAPLTQNKVTTLDYLVSFTLKFVVILILTWIMHRVMSMLDTPKKRILFIFLLGSSFSLYNEVDLFWSDTTLAWSFAVTIGESLN